MLTPFYELYSTFLANINKAAFLSGEKKKTPIKMGCFCFIEVEICQRNNFCLFFFYVHQMKVFSSLVIVLFIVFLFMHKLRLKQVDGEKRRKLSNHFHRKKMKRSQE